MGTECVKRYEQELNEAKNTLVQLNDNIRRIIGRRNEKYRTVHHDNNNKKSDGGERNIQKTSNDIMKQHKRRSNDAKSVFNRLSAAVPSNNSGDEEPRPRLTSRVIRELPSRQEIVAAQGTDSESRARNRRIFGTLLGTLQKFCQEESRLKDKEQKKADIEKKVEEQALQERLALKRERELLFNDRKRKQLEIRILETKMNRLRDFEAWESTALHMKNFIRTKTKPHIFYKPKKMCKKLDKLQEETKTALENDIKKKREELNKELADIENNTKLENCDTDEHFENNNRSYTLLDDFNCQIKVEVKEEKPKTKRRNHEPQTTNDSNGDVDDQEYKAHRNVEPSLSSRVVVVSTQKDQQSY